MICGIGIDLFSVSHLAHLDGDWNDPFFRRTFTVEECRQALATPDPLARFSAGFAAKEACFKALGVGSNDVRLSQISILDDEFGGPSVQMLGPASDSVPHNAIFHVVTAFSGDRVIALVVLEVPGIGKR